MLFPIYLTLEQIAILEVPDKLTKESFDLAKEQLEFYLKLIERISIVDDPQ